MNEYIVYTEIGKYARTNKTGRAIVIRNHIKAHNKMQAVKAVILLKDLAGYGDERLIWDYGIYRDCCVELYIEPEILYATRIIEEYGE